MKIFGSFDTQKDERDFAENVARYGEGNSVLARPSPLHFVFRGGDAVWMLLMLAGVVAITFFQYPKLPVIQWSFIALYASGVGLWLALLAKHVVFRLGTSKPFHNRWDNAAMNVAGFERLVRLSLWLFVFQVVLAGANVVTSILVHSSRLDLYQIGFSILQGLVNMGFVAFVWKLTINLIDMEMDYIIVTPDEVVFYNQTGFFNRSSFSIGAGKIKSIVVEKRGLVASFFNLGKIEILTEGDDDDGKIVFDYVWRADAVHEEFLRIIRPKSSAPDAA